jgi:phenylpropionate dioxygenase-like ring-hydroxylating dioxygenase large terminal subunit
MPLGNVVDPSWFAQVRKPHLEASSLPSFCYTSEELFTLEKEWIFRSSWLFVGRDEFLPEVGSYVTRELLGTPIIVIRDKSGVPRAFLNSCRHRGSRILDGAGQASSIRCPFHSWNYSLDGCLIGAPGSAGLPNFTKSDVRLDEVRCESAGGFIFVCFDSAARTLSEYLGDFMDRVIKTYNTQDMRCIHKRRYTLASNWKTYVEVDMETLHTDFIHKESIGTQPVDAPITFGNWVTVVHNSPHSPALPPKERELGFPAMEHLPPDVATKTHFSIALPGFFVITAPDCMWWINKIPLSATETAVDVGYCFPEQYRDREDFVETSQRYVRRWDQVIHEDDIFTEYQQRGLVAARPGRYADSEEVVHRLDNWILDRVLGEELSEVG